MQDNSNAIKKATAIKNAIVEKYKAHGLKGNVRLIETKEFSYIELGFTPQGKSVLDEIAVAYSTTYFDEMTTVEIMRSRGQRLAKDVALGLGISSET